MKKLIEIYLCMKNVFLIENTSIIGKIFIYIILNDRMNF